MTLGKCTVEVLRGDIVDHTWDDAELQSAVAAALEKQNLWVFALLWLVD